MFLSVVNQNLLLGLVSKVNSFMWDFLLLILLCEQVSTILSEPDLFR